jgi:glycosyltransferase involved in cell wall biosynthesis
VERYDAVADRRALREQLNLDATRRYIACIARFHPVKDHHMLIEAFARVARDLPDVDLLLVGDGPLRPDLQAQVAAIDLQSRVRFMGVRSDVPEILKAVDVFALTSVSEAASITLLEAMATGLPVVVTNVGGNPEIVRAGIDGELVPRGDAAEMGDALRKVLTHSTLARSMGLNGAQQVRERYRLDRTIERYARIYKDLQAERAQGST